MTLTAASNWSPHEHTTAEARRGGGKPLAAWLRGYLGRAAARTNTFLGERYRRIARRRGAARAQVAAARAIMIIIWHLLNDPPPTTTTSDPATIRPEPTRAARPQ